jgi:hypothetical protein
MTTEFVPFFPSLYFQPPASGFGKLLLRKSNTSDLTELDDVLVLSVIFE